ncbi:hypothetical protein [Tessaracoccus defluvii]|uniref:Uncharacterized protein n=1 Tax=Tessaracoccus defluvii TaxID=1285901 RepID=A0A7H0H7F8_9ACTN|nr:hypothetical protein [Tessaracoccus defluvii]QNP56474.1 hypothetical protein H9L22_03315 [Tessaracoccus defluvii]
MSEKEDEQPGLAETDPTDLTWADIDLGPDAMRRPTRLETALASLVPPGPVVPLHGVDLVLHTEPKHHDD